MAIPLQYDVLARDKASGTFDRVARSMDRAHRQSRNFESGFSRVGRTVGRVASGITRAVGGIAIAVGGIAIAGATMGLKTAASLEQAQISFETLLGTGQRAKAFLDELKTFAAATPFELPGLVAASRQLIGAGEAAKDVIPTLTAWGDATGALGLNQEQFERIMLAVTQSMSKGKVQAEELMQMTEAGIPIWPLLAKAMNRTVPELQELSREGKLLAADVFPALERQMNKDYGGAMARQAKTLNGLWSTFKDTLNLGLADVVTSMMPMLRNNMPAAIEVMRAKLAQLADWMKTTGVPAIRDFAGWLRNDLFPALKQYVTDAFTGWAGAFQGFLAAFNGGKDTVGAFSTSLKGIGDALTQVIIPAFGTFMRETLPLLGTTLGTLLNIQLNLTLGWINMALTGVRAFNRLNTGVINAIGGILNAADRVRFLLGPGIGAAVHASVQGFEDFARGAKQNMGDVEDSLVGMQSDFEAFRDMLAGLGWQSGANYVNGLTAAIVAGQAGAVAAAQGTINKLQSGGGDLLGIAGQPTSKDKGESKKAGADLGGAFGSGLAGGVAPAIDAVGEAAKNATDKASRAAQSAADKAKQKLAEIKSAFDSLRESARDSVLSFFSLKSEGNPFAGLGGMAKKATRFANALARLSKQGVHPAVIAQIAQAGPDVGLRAAEMLSTAGKANRGIINRAYERIERAADRAGNTVATAQYGDQLAVARKSERHLATIAKAVSKGKGGGNALNAGWSAA